MLRQQYQPARRNAGLAGYADRHASPGIAAHCRPCSAGCAVSQDTNHQKGRSPVGSRPNTDSKKKWVGPGTSNGGENRSNPLWRGIKDIYKA